MAVNATKYVRKPLYVDAVLVTNENFADVLTWCHGDLFTLDGTQINRSEGVNVDPEKHFIRIRVHNPQSPRQSRAFVGDWILYTEKGYKIYTEKAFKGNFDAVPETIRTA